MSRLLNACHVHIYIRITAHTCVPDSDKLHAIKSLLRREVLDRYDDVYSLVSLA